VQVIFSLLLVLAAILLVAWLFRRMNVAQKGNANLLKVLGGVSIGQRERVVLLEVEDTWLVVGVGPGQIRTLHTLQKSTVATTAAASATQPDVPFSAWLKKVIEKRDAA
jgi:flagellar protein FliO/FliZ